nr:immunoglobulin heavy chain junction region [Macaca mulatta]MOX58661.1 immunoglobulin heavy chain junction region [Macaca mulatta]MOX58761.1 immunoglobulin heavy chain junction region [Macaca mulatta]MOX58846.1 immunoglobulin heavy chain junction region [Macaca mulatta]MOX58859.1 immunoglobulin heavy chain junction region [Macaca mulatta]
CARGPITIFGVLITGLDYW